MDPRLPPDQEREYFADDGARRREGARPRRVMEQTLVEQMRISDVEIARRKELLGLSAADLELLAGCRTLIERRIEDVVERFYEQQLAVDEIALLIGDADTLRRLRLAQRRYVLDLFGGVYDDEYVNNRLRIGLVHRRIGVEPKLYLSAVRALKEIVGDVLRNEFHDEELVARVENALDRLLYFDVTLVFDTYIRSLLDEVSIAREREEAYARSLERKVAERTAQLRDAARRDALTGLYNRRALRELLRRELAHARRDGQPLSVIYLDLDGFKEINDRHGHHRGDEMLCRVARVLADCFREVDVPCRLGGDEFCVVLPDCPPAAAEQACQRLHDALDEADLEMAVSIGIAHTGPEEFVDGDALLRRADARMYEAKRDPGFQVRG